MTEIASSPTTLRWYNMLDKYVSECGLALEFEFGYVKSALGMELPIWVLRGADGAVIDIDVFRSRICPRQNLVLVDKFSEEAPQCRRAAARKVARYARRKAKRAAARPELHRSR
jgi:hypothetical protein